MPEKKLRCFVRFEPFNYAAVELFIVTKCLHYSGVGEVLCLMLQEEHISHTDTDIYCLEEGIICFLLALVRVKQMENR